MCHVYIKQVGRIVDQGTFKFKKRSLEQLALNEYRINKKVTEKHREAIDRLLRVFFNRVPTLQASDLIEDVNEQVQVAREEHCKLAGKIDKLEQQVSNLEGGWGKVNEDLEGVIDRVMQ